MQDDTITFSFGANWQSFLEGLTPERVTSARADIESWLGADWVRGKRVVDIGCGSGIHSLCFHGLGAERLVSFDVDPKSVAATRSLWERAGRPSNWQVLEGSILDPLFVAGLADPGFDLVYSWGVLHHTGAMWEAVSAAVDLVSRGGLFWIALYVKGPRYTRDLALKRRYNRASPFGKRMIAWRVTLRTLAKAVVLRNLAEVKRLLFSGSSDKERGMNVHHDLVDWLGGLPYEVASVGEVVEFTRHMGLVLEKIRTAFEGGNNVFLLSRPDSSCMPDDDGGVQRSLSFEV